MQYDFKWGAAPNPGIFIDVIHFLNKDWAANATQNHVTVIAFRGCTVAKF
jgi:hypothetical protein